MRTLTYLIKPLRELLYTNLIIKSFDYILNNIFREIRNLNSFFIMTYIAITVKKDFYISDAAVTENSKILLWLVELSSLTSIPKISSVGFMPHRLGMVGCATFG